MRNFFDVCFVSASMAVRVVSMGAGEVSEVVVVKAVTEGAQADAEAAVTLLHGHLSHSTSRTQHYFSTTDHRSRRISHLHSQNLHANFTRPWSASCRSSATAASWPAPR